MTPWIAAHQALLSVTNSWSMLKLMRMKSVMPYNHLILCHSLLFLPSIFPSIRVFSNESVLHIRWPKYWSFSFSISPSNEYSGLISFRIDWFDLLQNLGKTDYSSNVCTNPKLRKTSFSKCFLWRNCNIGTKNLKKIVIWLGSWIWISGLLLSRFVIMDKWLMSLCLSFSYL